MDFDIRRDPNPHPSFGHGFHYCLGANLARLEMRVMFEELLPAFERYELVQPVEWTHSNRHTGSATSRGAGPRRSLTPKR